MTRMLARPGRLLQYLGVALAAHAVTMHALVWRQVRESGEAHPSLATSWGHVSVGMVLAAVLFATGLWLERRSRKQQEPGHRGS